MSLVPIRRAIPSVQLDGVRQSASAAYTYVEPSSPGPGVLDSIRSEEVLAVDINDIMLRGILDASGPSSAWRHHFVGHPEERHASLVRPLGFGDLFLIRQQIKEYRPGEVSHIENVLSGEVRERVHTRRTRLEELTVREEEQETEEERSLQTTNRAELEREVNTVVKEQFDARAGVQVSASYGAVSVEARGEVSVSRAREESARSAQRLAREVVETAKERVRERVLERRERRLVQELEEVDTHRFANEGGPNVSGVYQWVDKVYQAEVFRYGKRLMYELLVPEPGAGLIAAAQAGQASGFTATRIP